MPSTQKNTHIYQHPEAILQQLIRFNTTNPPGNEAECIGYIDALLKDAGVQTTLIADDSARPNLIARLTGQGNAPPLLLQGHVDVVTAESQVWQHPPFEGKIVEETVWGRGALDMKGGVAMMLAALLRAKAEGTTLPGDVLLAVVSDEEVAGEHGAKYLVEHHAALFKDVRYALGEVGGFSTYIGGQKFYFIQVLEKQICWFKTVVRGPGGHGSIPMHGGAMAKLGRLLQQLDQHRLPTHITPIPRQMLATMAEVLSTSPVGSLFRQLLDPAQVDQTLEQLGPQRTLFEPILHNTVNATIVRGGDKINVIPSEIIVELDSRLLPGYTADDMFHELHQFIGEEVEFEIIRTEGGRTEADMGFFNTLADVLQETDLDSIAVPVLMPAVTDGRFFSRLGIQPYGFLPMNLPQDFNYLRMLHAADERIPVKTLQFGANALYEVLQRNKE